MGKILQGIGKLFNDITGKTSAMQMEQEYNAEQAELNRQFQERMSSTAIERQVADAKSAGINPAMLYSNSSASGASTPSGSTAHSSALGGETASGLLNSVANVASSFNRDRNRSNDVSFREVANTAVLLSKILK